MNALQRWWHRLFGPQEEHTASLRRVRGQEVPDTGRSSVEGTLGDRLSASLAFWGGVSPVIDFEMLKLLKHLWIFNPDLSQYVANIVSLANTGHTITVDASSKRRSEQAVARLNEAASRIYRIGAGVDGLINAYLAQIAWSGAVSSEDVVNFGARRVERVALVPVEQIRFRYIDGEYVPHQQPGVGAGLLRSPLGLIPLSPVTYRYYALTTVENSPYAKPPASAAVAAITGPQTDMLDNIGFIARKLGLLGLVSISVVKPEMDDDETPQQYRARAQSYLAEVGAAASKLSKNGLVVTFDDQKVEHDSVTSDARGAYEVFRMNEEQVFSGMATIPAFHGRTDSSTETYADVVYNLLLAQKNNIQRLAKRRHESTCRLDLMLEGLQVDGVSLKFNRDMARNPKQQAEADKINEERAILKAEKGVISPDDAAQEMGYDSCYDPELLVSNREAAEKLQGMSAGGRANREGSLTVRFDRASQSYRYAPEVIHLNGDSAAGARSAPAAS
jgi:hypothetical protein